MADATPEKKAEEGAKAPEKEAEKEKKEEPAKKADKENKTKEAVRSMLERAPAGSDLHHSMKTWVRQQGYGKILDEILGEKKPPEGEKKEGKKEESKKEEPKKEQGKEEEKAGH